MLYCNVVLARIMCSQLLVFACQTFRFIHETEKLQRLRNVHEYFQKLCKGNTAINRHENVFTSVGKTKSDDKLDDRIKVSS